MRVVVHLWVVVGMWWWSVEATNETLRAGGSRHNLFMGSEISYGHAFNTSEPIYKNTHAKQYSLATAGNSCKWTATHPEQGKYTLGHCTQLLQLAAAANQVFRGHNLCWGNYNPKWLVNGGFNPDELRGLLRDHIKYVMQGVRDVGPVYGWDVVNEAVGTQGGFKDVTPWYPAVQDYVDVAFTAAADADKTTKLFYNDYGAETINPKSTYILNMTQSMKSRGIKVDGVGFQFHIKVTADGDVHHLVSKDINPHTVQGTYARVGRVGDYIQRVKDNFARFAAEGLEIHITELDIRTPDPSDFSKQADLYSGLLTACLTTKTCRNFETWGFTDRYTWLWNFQNPTHKNVHPLPFDMDYDPKPAFDAMLKALA